MNMGFDERWWKENGRLLADGRVQIVLEQNQNHHHLPTPGLATTVTVLGIGHGLSYCGLCGVSATMRGLVVVRSFTILMSQLGKF